MARKAEELKEVGNNYLKDYKYDEAIQCYSESLNIDPYNKKLNSLVLANRGYVYQRKKDHLNAISDFDKSIDLNPNYFKVKKQCTLWFLIGIYEKSRFLHGIRKIWSSINRLLKSCWTKHRLKKRDVRKSLISIKEGKISKEEGLL